MTGYQYRVKVVMDGDSTDEESVAARPAASSSSVMSNEELHVLRKLQQRVSMISPIVRVLEIHKPFPGMTWIVCQVAIGASQNVEVRISHEVDPRAGRSRFSLYSDCAWLREFCNSANISKSLNCVIDRINEAVEQRRLTVLMDSLRIENSEVGSEASEERSLSSGTTAASPQSSRSTTTSLP